MYSSNLRMSYKDDHSLILYLLIVSANVKLKKRFHHISIHLQQYKIFTGECVVIIKTMILKTQAFFRLTYFYHALNRWEKTPDLHYEDLYIIYTVLTKTILGAVF